MCVWLYQYCQLFLFPILNSIFLFKRAWKRTQQESKHGLWLLQHFHPLTFNMQLYTTGFPLALKLFSWQRPAWSCLVKNLSFALLCPPPYLQKPKLTMCCTKGTLSGSSSWHCMFSLEAEYCHQFPSSSGASTGLTLIDTGHCHTWTDMKWHQKGASEQHFQLETGKEWSYSCTNSWLKMWPQWIWKYDHSLSLI